MDMDTTIIGAGPYGLSIAAHLRAKNRQFALFGTPLESWSRYMPKGMILKSEPFASNLWDPARRFTLEQYLRSLKLSYQPLGQPLALERFLQYADWFQCNTIGDLQNIKVKLLGRTHGGFRLQLIDGRRLTSRRVVLATGHMPFGVVPPELSELPSPLVVHSSRMEPVQSYAGLDVTILGAGQSALESAALLYEAGARVRLLVRESRLLWNEHSKPRPLRERIRAPDAGIASGWGAVAISELPRMFRWKFSPAKRHRYVMTSFGASGAWWLRGRVENRIETWLESRVQAASIVDSRLLLRVARPDGIQEIWTDRLIAATGFSININRLDYLATELLESIQTEAEGIPALSANYETSVPGLYIVGVASSPVFGPIMRFMYGAKHVAPVLARNLP